MLFHIKKIIILIGVWFVAAAASADPMPSPQLFTVCAHHGCTKTTKISAFEREWGVLRSWYQQHPIRTPHEERIRIAEAIGLMETLVGQLTGTAIDKGRNSFIHTDGQMDCVDESINTTTYLKMMAQEGWLRFHQVADRAYRWLPHWTAVIVEMQTGEQFAVDSWFYDNGMPAAVLPLADWQRGEGGEENEPIGLKNALPPVESVAQAQSMVHETFRMEDH